MASSYWRANELQNFADTTGRGGATRGRQGERGDRPQTTYAGPQAATSRGVEAEGAVTGLRHYGRVWRRRSSKACAGSCVSSRAGAKAAGKGGGFLGVI